MSDLFRYRVHNQVNGSEVTTDPILLGTASQIVTDQHFYITELTFYNSSEDDVTVQVMDRQGTPLPVMLKLLQAGEPYGYVWKGRVVPNGFTWLASTAGVVTATARGYR